MASLCVFFGSISLLDVRLLGIGLKRETVRDIAEQILPFAWAGFAGMAGTGGLLLVSEAVKCYHSRLFRAKLILIAFAGLNALLFHLTAYRTVDLWGTTTATNTHARWAGAASLTFWITVIVLGRSVGYF